MGCAHFGNKGRDMTPEDAAEEKRSKFMMKLVVILFGVGMLVVVVGMMQGCTISCINTCTVGSASDTVDAPTSTEADVSPDISVPLNKM